MKFLILLCIGFLLAGCASTHWEIDPQTQKVLVTTDTLMKKVEGFTLNWTELDDHTTTLSVKIEKSSTEAQIIDAFAPIITAMAPMLRELAPVMAAKVQAAAAHQ
jgi:uncharacterized protein YcfL